jgi:hypothetical protein
MTDLETLLAMRGVPYDRSRVEARADEIAERLLLSQGAKEQPHFHEMPSKTDLEHLRELQGYRDYPGMSAPLAAFVVLLIAVALGFAIAFAWP